MDIGACGATVLVVPTMYVQHLRRTRKWGNDLPDVATEVTETGRLGCQVKIARELEGLEVILPGILRDLEAKRIVPGTISTLER